MCGVTPVTPHMVIEKARPGLVRKFWNENTGCPKPPPSKNPGNPGSFERETGITQTREREQNVKNERNLKTPQKNIIVA